VAANEDSDLSSYEAGVNEAYYMGYTPNRSPHISLSYKNEAPYTQRGSIKTLSPEFPSTSKKDKHPIVINYEDEDENPAIWTPIPEKLDENQSFYTIADEEQIDEDEDPAIWAEIFKKIDKITNDKQSLSDITCSHAHSIAQIGTQLN